MPDPTRPYRALDPRLLKEGSAAAVRGLSNEALTALAARVSPAGLYLLQLDGVGKVTFADPSAAPFFLHYVLPIIQSAADQTLRDADGQSLSKWLGSQGRPNNDVSLWRAVPGLLLATFTCTEPRRSSGTILLAARTEASAVPPELQIEADALPTYGVEALLRQARLLSDMVRDQLRLGVAEAEVANLSHQLSSTYEELHLIYQISSGMRINRGTGDFFKQACLGAMDVMGVAGIGIVLDAELTTQNQPLLNPFAPPATGVAGDGGGGQRAESSLFGQIALPTDTMERLSGMLLPLLQRRGGALVINDLSRDRAFSWLAAHARQLLAVPLQRNDQLLGCFFALNKSAGPFDSRDSQLLYSIANESAIYLENAILFDDAHGLMMGLLHSLTSAVDAKDTYTCGHSQRVAAISKQLAIDAGFGDDFAGRVYMAGLLHDVGKIGVPEHVLQKPGKLTDEEFAQMKRHPIIGARILEDVKQIGDLIPGVLHHHERFDGRGYPHNLAGEEIPLMGRIICLADSFDAMTSSRTYRNALSLEAALTEIDRCRGTHFDPALTGVFLNIGMEKLIEITRPRVPAVAA